MFGNKKNSFNDTSGHVPNHPSRASIGPRFERGDIKLIMLDLLQEKSRHGYEIIQELEKKFSGCYTPSSGTIYPTLQLLEDQELLTSHQKSGKKVYTITENGIKFLQDNETTLNEMNCRIGSAWGEHSELIAEIKSSFNEASKLLLTKIANDELSEQQKNQLKQTFKNLGTDVIKIITE